MPDQLTNLDNSIMSFPDAAIALAVSLLASIVTYFMYQIFYGSKNIGAGVHRTFLIGGPAVLSLIHI